MSKIEINVTCKDCLFYKDLVHPSEHFTCSNAGYLEYASPCKNFCFNAKKLRLINATDKDIYAILRKIPTEQLNNFAAMVIQEGYNRSEGWSVGDIAYYNLGKEDYISSYVQVIFKGLAGNLGLAIVEGNKQGEREWNGVLPFSSLLRKDEWQLKHEQLVQEGKILSHSLDSLLPGYQYPTEEELKSPNYIPCNISHYSKYFPKSDLTTFIENCKNVEE